MIARLAALLATLALAACAALSPIRTPPEVSVADLRLREVGLFEQRFALVLRVLNPNDAELPIDGLRFTLELNERPFAHGVSSHAVVVPRLGEALLEVDAVSSTAGLLRQFRALSDQGDRLEVRIHGSVLTGTVLGEIPFDRRSELRLGEAPERGRF